MKSLPEVLIVGLPNSGKSTLFNRLTRSRAAITSDMAHTTRDTNTGLVKRLGRGFTLVDSAGVTNEKDTIKAAAMGLIESRLESASAIVLVVDGSVPLAQADKELARKLHKTGKPLILAVNKADKTKLLQPEGEFAKLGIKTTLQVSAHQGDGCDELVETIGQLIPKKSAKDSEQSIKVAILGRPNVGKSSLLNALAGKELAIESATAHTTRDINSYALKFFGRAIEVVDTAGLRRPGKIGKMGKGDPIEFYSSLRSKAAIEEADVCIVLLDALEGLTGQDERILGLVKDLNKACIIVMNKWDGVEKDTHTMGEVSAKLRSELQYIYWAPLVFVSAKTGQNLEHLKKVVCEVYDRLDFTLSTSKLNRFIEEANGINPPSAIKTRRPKVNYATQTGTRPPKFTIFCTHPKLMHWSYTRFLQNRLRDQYELNGVPVIIEYRSKYKDVSS